jgi:glycosyltransferase involved in cell wall biosynthesis
MQNKNRRVLIIVENLPVPFDRRVWQEATTLQKAGYSVSVICPTGKNATSRFENLDGMDIFRYRNPIEADRPIGYVLEYGIALFWQFVLAVRVAVGRGFDVIHACNPPDNIFLIGAFFKLFGKKFLFDHHDVCPELFVAKFGNRPWLHRLAYFLERMTFKTANVSIATNESYKRIAIERGGMKAEDVFVVRSGPNLDRLTIQPPDPALKHGRRFLVGYVGVMGRQEGIDYLLRAARHIVVEMKRNDVHFGLVGGAPNSSNDRYAKESALGVRDLYRARAGCRAACDAEYRRRLRQSGRRQSDERIVDDEQGHGIHGPGQSTGAVRHARGPLLGPGRVAVRKT